MQSNEVDLKKTVHLPKTDFPMKANLPQMEPKLLQKWQEIDIYAKIRASRAGRLRYVLHDGPPYANGKIHLGTAFNKILKDMVVKSKTMAGFDSPYIPGWDCHGLPIEIKVDNELGSKKAKMTAAEIRGECRKYATKFIDLQRQNFKRLGVFGQWDDPYLTMSAEYEGVIAQAFVDFLDRGYVYKGLKPVNWCMTDRTALAEAEVEYKDHASPSVWVRFAMVSDPTKVDERLRGRRVYGLIWTTTPWTIPANLAICFNSRYEYSAVAVGRDVYIVASDLVHRTAEACAWVDPEAIATFPGSQLEGTVYRHPFLRRDSVGILGDHVTLEQGTGAVHTAPGHGQEDYVVGQQYKLPVYCPVDAAGRMTRVGGVDGDLPEVLLGKRVWDANPIVIGLLREYGALCAEKRVDHSYPHCWRCHNPTIFRATDQWFIGMDRKDLRQKTLEQIKRVKWLPGWGEERISNMIASRPDWCISRQRVWGVPIPVFYCDDCGTPLTDKKRLDRVADRFRRETADAWYEYSPEELLGPDVRCGSCGSAKLRKETDILDVWFDSGASHLAVLEQAGLPWPADMYLEGGDQYRGWFHSSLLIGMGLRDRSPYREVLTHGWTLDGEGRAMHKSLGNSIEPDEVIKKSGADVLRLWVASVVFYEDVRMSDTILTRLTEAYRKIRNTFRYMLGALSDFDPAVNAVPDDDLLELDRWVLVRLNESIESTRKSYERYEFHRAYQDLYSFCTTDLSAVYFDVVKDRLYTTATDSRERRSAQTALHRLCHALTRLMAPILVFTAEEVWQFLRRDTEPESVHLLEFPDPVAVSLDAAGRESWSKLMEVRESVTKALEVARQNKLIGAPLEAQVHLKAGESLYPLLNRYSAELPGLFIVSAVSIENHAAADLEVHVERATGEKCPRCWKYKSDIGGDSRYPTVCRSCADAVSQMMAHS